MHIYTYMYFPHLCVEVCVVKQEADWDELFIPVFQKCIWSLSAYSVFEK